MPSRLPSVARHVLVLVAAALAMAGCTGSTVVKDYGPDAKANFVDGCTIDRKVVDKQVIEHPLASRSTCVCIYESMRTEFRLPWDDVATYEQKVADAKPGQAPPMPARLEKAVKKCTTSGPAAPTTTTAKPKG